MITIVPFLRTKIINKGSLDNVKIGTNIYDKSYLVGRVIEVNFKSSRVLLLSDLNSSVPISISPGNVQAIIIGNGKNSGEIRYVKDNLIEDIKDQSIAYTSGTGSIYKSGIPVGKVNITDDRFLVNFYSDFEQLKYVFVEIDKEREITLKPEDEENVNSSSSTDTEEIKLNLLNEQLKISNETNARYAEENQVLKSEINKANNDILNLQIKIDSQNKKMTQNLVDQEELEFLKLNLLYSHKCQTKKLFNTGYKVGTKEYKDCILRKGRKLND